MPLLYILKFIPGLPLQWFRLLSFIHVLYSFCWARPQVRRCGLRGRHRQGRDRCVLQAVSTRRFFLSFFSISSFLNRAQRRVKKENINRIVDSVPIGEDRKHKYPGALYGVAVHTRNASSTQIDFFFLFLMYVNLSVLTKTLLHLDLSRPNPGGQSTQPTRSGHRGVRERHQQAERGRERSRRAVQKNRARGTSNDACNII